MVESYRRGKYWIEVVYDEHFDTSEELEMWGGDDIFLVAFARKYLWVTKDGFSKEDIDEMIEDENTEYTFLPLYGYMHGGITISLRPFSCRWDSGQIGWIVRRNGVDWCADDSKAERLVDLWDKACTNEVYLCNIYEGDECIDTVGGFIGMDSVEAFVNEYADENRE